MLTYSIILCSAHQCLVDFLNIGGVVYSNASLLSLELLRRSTGLVAMGLTGRSSCVIIMAYGV